jgi:hypothetical protein
LTTDVILLLHLLYSFVILCLRQAHACFLLIGQTP